MKSCKGRIGHVVTGTILSNVWGVLKCESKARNVGGMPAFSNGTQLWRILKYSSMELSQKKQEFSKAYVKAVAAACGYATHEPSVDDDSIDLGLTARGGSGTIRSPQLDLQLKCTARDIIGQETVDLSLKKKNYEELRPTNFLVPRILVVVLVPDDVAQWINHSEAELLLRHCGYWYSLRGMPPTENEHTVTLNIPRTQMFNVGAVNDMMRRIAEGGLP